jgi:hypothetical protein
MRYSIAGYIYILHILFNYYKHQRFDILIILQPIYLSRYLITVQQTSTKYTMDDLKQALAEFQALQACLPQLPRRGSSHHHSCRIRRNITTEGRTINRIPKYVTHYTPTSSMTQQEAEITRSNIQAYVATNHRLPARFTPDEMTFVIDTGASITITNCKEDFTSAIQQVQPTRLKGITSGLDVKGIGE